MHILAWILSRILAGWIAGLIMRGRGYGIIGDLILGPIGGIIGGWLARMVGSGPEAGWARSLRPSSARSCSWPWSAS